MAKKKPNGPELMTGCLESQLSIARFAGGCIYNGVHYDWRTDAPAEYNGVMVRGDIKLTTAELIKRLQQ